MPRKTAEALATLAVVERMPQDRPAPPQELSEAESVHWRLIVGNMPPGWFTLEMQSMLATLCSQIVTCEALESRIRAFDKGSLSGPKLDSYSQLVNLHLKVSTVAAQISTKLRLTPQSRTLCRGITSASTPSTLTSLQSSAAIGSASKPRASPASLGRLYS